MNKVRGRTPIARLNQSVEYMNLKQLSSYLRNEVLNDHVDAAAAAGKKPKMKLKYGTKEFEPSCGNMLLTFLNGAIFHVILSTFQ